MPLILLAFAALLAGAGCDVRDSLLSVLLVRPVFQATTTVSPDPPLERVQLARSATEETALREAFGLGGPFTGVDYRTEVLAVAARPLATAEGRVEIDRVELRGRETVAIRSRVVGRGGASAARLGVAAVAVDRFSTDFTVLEGDFR